MKEARKYLENLLKENDACVLALSGGPDSMCLLTLLLEIKKHKKIEIICAHVNHNTRPSCEKEEKFIREYLKKYNIPFEYYKIKEYQKGKFTEQEGREKRYGFLKQVVKKYNGTYLFTAHHVDDLTETIIMRILRGSTLSGYLGLKQDFKWEEVRIVRPLLQNTKKEILEYLKIKNIPYVTDESNEDETYKRNRIRKNILPLIEKEETNYKEKIIKFSKTLEKSNEIIEETLKELKVKLEEEHKIKKIEFLKLSKCVQEAYLKEYFKENYDKNLYKITDKHLRIALKMIENKKEKDLLCFPDKKLFKKDKKYIYLEKEKIKERYCIKLEEKVILPNGDIVEKQTKYNEKSNFEIHLNSKEISLPLYITTRKPGMKMAVKNLSGTKKISDILINCKIEQDKKDEIPLLIDNNGHILWVLGLKKSKYDLEKNENYDIIYKYQKKEGKDLWEEQTKMLWKIYFPI